MEKEKKIVIACNWKLNPTSLREAEDLIKSYLQLIDNLEQGKKELLQKGLVKIIAAIPSIYILRAVELVKEYNKSELKIAAQNCFSELKGAFTGEISAASLKELFCEYVLVGHSERRELFGESDRLIAQKVKLLKEQELVPVLCLGEKEEQREANLTDQVITEQLEKALSETSFGEKLTEKSAKSAKSAKQELIQELVIAYEPVWAIGTGKSCSAKEAQRVCQLIRALLLEKYGKVFSEQAVILYGGSIKANNIEKFLEQEDINGGLIGGASLDLEEFSTILKKAFTSRQVR